MDITELIARVKDLEFLTTEHTHKIYDVNDLARKNLHEKLDIERFKAEFDNLDERISKFSVCFMIMNCFLKLWMTFSYMCIQFVNQLNYRLQ